MSRVLVSVVAAAAAADEGAQSVGRGEGGGGERVVADAAQTASQLLAAVVERIEKGRRREGGVGRNCGEQEIGTTEQA